MKEDKMNARHSCKNLYTIFNRLSYSIKKSLEYLPSHSFVSKGYIRIFFYGSVIHKYTAQGQRHPSQTVLQAEEYV
jgi:hypothetical protein